MNVRLFGTFTLRSPLSHIGESISTTSYLVQEPILQPDGTLEEIFVYSGNAWRGQLRDLAATYMLEKLGTIQLPLDSFHLLFSGGRIGGEQVIDIKRARAYRRAIPMFALWGGGVGNQILPGKLRVSNCYPVCREAIVALPVDLCDEAEPISYRGLTFEKSFSRKDDAKDDRLRGFIVEAPAPVEAPQIAESAEPGDPEQPAEQMTLEGLEIEEEPPKAQSKEPPKEKPQKAKDGPADQMRMTVELVSAGVRLYTEIDALDVSEVELGALVSALHAFSRSPHIGGQANKGHGKVALEYQLLDLDTGETQDFLNVSDGPSRLAPSAESAKKAYDEYLRNCYEALLTAQGGEIKALLGVS